MAALLADAEAAGAVLAVNSEVQGVVPEPGGRQVVEVRDTVTGELSRLAARIVINAAGGREQRVWIEGWWEEEAGDIWGQGVKGECREVIGIVPTGVRGRWWIGWKFRDWLRLLYSMLQVRSLEGTHTVMGAGGMMDGKGRRNGRATTMGIWAQSLGDVGGGGTGEVWGQGLRGE